MQNRISAYIIIVLVGLLISCQRPVKKKSNEPIVPPLLNSLTADEITDGWELLFDGNSLAGWKRYNNDSIGPLWKVVDGSIVCDGKGLTEGTADIGGSLITLNHFENFDLSLEWKIGAGGNSGILYHVVEGKQYHHDYETGPEYQLMDDDGWKGDKLRGAQKAGSNYDMFAAPPDKKLMPVGDWNVSRLLYSKGHVEQWLNGLKVVEFEENSSDFKNRFAKSKWTGYPDWNKAKQGAISLQDHGASVAFRNVKIKSL